MLIGYTDFAQNKFNQRNLGTTEFEMQLALIKPENFYSKYMQRNPAYAPNLYVPPFCKAR